MNTRSESSSLSFLEVIQIAWANKWLVIGISLLLAVLAGVYAFQSDRVYRSSTLLIYSQNSSSGLDASQLSGQLGFLGSLVGGAMSGSSYEESLAFLSSRALAAKFLSDNNLLPVIFDDVWDSDKERWTDPEAAPSMSDAIKKFDKEIFELDTSRDGGLIVLSMRWTDPEVAAGWANDYVTLTNETLRQSAIREAEQSLRYLEDELAQASVLEIKSAILALVEQQLQSIMLANVQKQFAYKVIDPAYASDSDDYVSPNIPLTIVIGFISGFAIALFIALIRFRST